jgi:hypothetical protein
MVHHGLVAAKHPVIAVRALDPHACLVAGDDLGPTQGRESRLAAGSKARFGPAQHGHQTALTDREAEQVGEHGLKPLI